MTYDVEITGYGSGGEGVARLPDGKAVFVPGAVRGDMLEARITKEKPRSAKAKIVRILMPSQYRIEPDCPVYQRCGGCSFRHVTYEEELWAKLRRVNDALQRIGGLSVRVDEILATGQTSGYRNKAVIHSDGVSHGFYAPRSHDVIPIDHCLLLKDDINAALKQIPPSRETAHCFGSYEQREPGTDITLCSGRYGLDGPLEEELDGLVFEMSGFFQVNTKAALLLYQKARQYAAMSANETLVDLYCGVGSLTLFIGRDAASALGVELNPGAVEAARRNACRNGFSHIEFIAADAADWEYTTEIPDCTVADCVVVDPPRGGLSPGAVQKIVSLSPHRIVYVSCDPATLARDLQSLKGYTVKDACAVDMFPRTANVECCCLLEKTHEGRYY